MADDAVLDAMEAQLRAQLGPQHPRDDRTLLESRPSNQALLQQLFAYTELLHTQVNHLRATKAATGTAENVQNKMQEVLGSDRDVSSTIDDEPVYTPTEGSSSATTVQQQSRTRVDYAAQVALQICHALGPSPARQAFGVPGLDLTLNEEHTLALAAVEIPTFYDRKPGANHTRGPKNCIVERDAATRFALATEVLQANATAHTRHEWRRIAIGRKCLSSRWRGEDQCEALRDCSNMHIWRVGAYEACANCIAQCRLCIQKTETSAPTLALLPETLKRAHFSGTLRFVEFVDPVDISGMIPPTAPRRPGW